MPRLTRTDDGDECGRPGPLRSSFVSMVCLCRSLPLFWRASPKTPLRVLCIVALETVHRLRSSRPLSLHTRRRLAAMLDFQACTNARWDRKSPHGADDHALRRHLEDDGLGQLVAAYESRLGALETRRPPVGGGGHVCDDVREYREAVVRLSLATLIAAIPNTGSIDGAIRFTYADRDVATLFQLAMQCQVIDDVCDYGDDLSAGLPSFLTAPTSMADAVTWTARAVRSYAATSGRPCGRGAWPLEAALSVVTLTARFVVGLVPTRVAWSRRAIRSIR